MARCADCIHYEYNFFESELDGSVEWMECKAKPQVANLKYFPFERTTCTAYDTKEPNS